jgi:acyl-CoA synthetase (AMP-forming)/AMP-acid ligase II
MMTASNAPPWAWIKTPAPHQHEFAKSNVWGKQTLADRAIELEAQEPDFVAFVDGARHITRSMLLRDATALAWSLASRGVLPGDVVSFQVPNWHEAAVINLAAALAGFVVNPVVPIYRDREVKQMLGDCRARVLFVAASFRGFDYSAMADRLRSSLPDLAHIFTVRGTGENDFAALVEQGLGEAFVRPQIDPLGVKLVLYTSGTTGHPKAVLHSHVTLQHIVEKSAAHWGILPGEATLMPSPVTHVSGFANGLELPLLRGTCTVLMESWNAHTALDLIEQHQLVGTVAATPFLVELAAAARATGNRLPSLRFFACGGAAVPPEVIPAAIASFANCHAFRVFGSSEVPLVTFGWPHNAALAATTDGEIVDYAVRVVDRAGQDVPDGVEGEILARGPGMMLGYADRAQTSEAITPDGYFRTGDLGVRTVDGALTITGREKDLIIRGGENISAKEIEDVLHQHPAVREAAVVSMPNDRLGEGVCAYIILRADRPGETELAEFVVSSGLAKQKIPERFEWVADFPRTASGKVRKDQLRQDIRQKLAP